MRRYLQLLDNLEAGEPATAPVGMVRGVANWDSATTRLPSSANEI
jgi:hypothetical protein